MNKKEHDFTPEEVEQAQNCPAASAFARKMAKELGLNDLESIPSGDFKTNPQIPCKKPS